MKFLNKLKRQPDDTIVTENYFKDMPNEERIKLLALMCESCRPHAVKGLVIPRYSALYVLRDDDDLPIVKQLFDTQGVHLKKDKAIMNGVDWFTILRSRFFLVQNEEFCRIKDLMKDIKRTSNEIAKKDEWWDLQTTLASIREDFKLKTK